jgi:RHS repeat-associated protein
MVDYDAHGSPVTIAFTGGVRAEYDHDPVMRRLRSASLSGGLSSGLGLVRRVSLTHDRNGHVHTMTEDIPGERFTRTFTYDGLHRLTGAALHDGQADGPLRRDDRYTYSMTGDLVRDDESMSGPLEYGDAAHPGRLTRVRLGGGPGPVDLGYDAAGRMTSFGELQELRYDVWDRLVEVRAASGRIVTFAYDHTGALVRRGVRSPGGGADETRFVDRLYESGPDGERLQVHLGRLLVAEVHRPPAGGVGDERTAFVLTDHLGSVLAGCTPAGEVVHQQIYSPFGLSLRPSGPLDAYAGTKPEPELGLVRFGSRWYAPALGRFVTPDWYVAENPERALRLPQALNAYSYAINNPLSFRDPTGMWFGIDDLIVAGVGFAVGFIAGTIYGLATGQSLGDSLLRGLEAGILGAVGAWLAWNTAGLALGLLGVSGAGGVGFGIMVGAAVVGGMNGTISGMTRIYDWSSPSGWGAFLLDSSWGLAGSAMGNLLHIVNLFYGSSRNYRPELSERKNRHVYDGGFGFGNFAFTQGNVISNLNGRRTDLVDHEHLHVWQNRMFGPVFTLTYVAWLVVGALVGLAMAPFTDQSWTQDVKDVAYLNNPWETWAYDTGGSGNGGELSWT